MKKLFRVPCLVGAMLGVMLVTTSIAAEKIEPLNPPVKIRINSPGLVGQGGMFLAYDKGYFKDEGLNVALDSAAGVGNTTDTLSQLATGQLEIGTFPISASLFNAISRKIGVVGLVPLNVMQAGNKSSGIIVRQDLIDSGAYKSPADLKGKKIAVFNIGASGHYSVMQALKSAGLEESDVQLINMSFPDGLVALGNKAVDAAFEPEPFIAAAHAKKIGTLAINEGDTSTGAPSIVLFASEKFAKEQDEALKRLVTALMKGQRDYAAAVEQGSGPLYDELLDSLARHSMIKDKARLQSITLPPVDVNGSYDPKQVESMQAFFLEQDVQAKPIDLTQLFDRSYTEYALKRLGSR